MIGHRLVRERMNRGKGEVEVCGSRKIDVARFGGGKKFSLCFEF